MEIDVGTILEDLKSIKLPKSRRVFVNDARELYQKSGCLPSYIKTRLIKFLKLYSRQFKELYASRERARKTLWRIREGITREKADEMVMQRLRNVAEQKSDLGI
jgi:hypothetical protein